MENRTPKYIYRGKVIFEFFTNSCTQGSSISLVRKISSLRQINRKNKQINYLTFNYLVIYKDVCIIIKYNKKFFKQSANYKTKKNITNNLIYLFLNFNI